MVSGKRTASGHPILANDPHRVITNPAVRYITHLVAPGWNVIGAGEPASPGVAIGHNDRIAFGLTVVGMDQQDVYVEALGACPPAGAVRAGDSAVAGGPPHRENAPAGSNPLHPSSAGTPTGSLACYRFRGAWRPLRTITDTIRVKGEPPRAVQLQFTSHGPVVSVDSARHRAFAIRSVHSEPGTAAYLASLSLDRARNWREFQAAMARWQMPSENMVYADVDGNIGWVAGGLMPRRSWSGLLPVPGDGRYEWTGFVPGAELPRAFNPPAGFIATANNDIRPPGYRIPISYEWASHYRVDRLREVLGAPRRFTVADFEQLQHDDFSRLAQVLVPPLVAAARRQGAAARPEVALLAGWNLHMSRDQLAPTVFDAWAPALWRHAIAAALADTTRVAATLAGRPDYEWLEHYLSAADPPGGEAGRDLALLDALDDAVADLTKRFGTDRAHWRWGEVHVAVFRHPLSPRYDLPPASRGGDANTVYATGGRDYHQTAGASYREILDLGDWDRSVVTNVPGQSGDPRSRHYGDLLPLWANDRYFPLAFSRARVEAETEQVLWLRPPAP